MRVDWLWLKEFVLPPVGPEELARLLPLQGLEVAALELGPRGWEGVRVARVVAVEPHPDADQLRVCRLEAGLGRTVQVVSGAPNLRAGMLAVWAPPGSRLPGRSEPLAAVRFRGVLSEGMLCAGDELGLPGGDHGGVLELAGGEPGEPAERRLPAGDAVLELELTPNYAVHCQSVLGVAREVAARFGLPLPAGRAPEVDWAALTASPEAPVIELEAPDGCGRYVALLLEGVRPLPSPAEVQRRLRAAGVRPINALVDATNYVMLETGQPLHAFDADRLAWRDGRPLVGVRRARPGERLVTLDGAERELSREDLVIASGERPVGLAGVMGGAGSQVDEGTRRILLESAWFEPRSIRRTSRRLGLATEAAGRFEKGVDPALQRAAALRAAELVAAWTGGRLVAAAEAAGRLPEERTVRWRPERTRSLLGAEIEPGEQRDLLERLGFRVEEEAGAGGGSAFLVRVPSWRGDVEGEADLAEEVARLAGYERIPSRLAVTPAHLPEPDRPGRLRRLVRETLVGAGLTEAVGYPLQGEERLRTLGFDPAGCPRLANPITREQAYLEPSLLPSLVESAEENRRQGRDEWALFEIGRRFARSEPGGVVERMAVGFLVRGRLAASWAEPGRPADFFTGKGLVEALLERLAIREVRFVRGGPAALHPGRAAELREAGGEGRLLGWVGELHPAVGRALDWPEGVVAGELDLDALLPLAQPPREPGPLPRYPGVARDLSLVVPEEEPAEKVAEAIRQAAGPWLDQLRLFDVYHGEEVGAGRKSLAFSLTYRAPDRTLSDEEVAGVHEAVRRRLKEEGAQLRS
ncbi:MAG: phenylalanine--tRNA ligase subunit beta [Bacillota bacterium]|nr:phenylalanine--tRNA ligase subunit beta [Bacillota bacterium]